MRPSCANHINSGSSQNLKPFLYLAHGHLVANQLTGRYPHNNGQLADMGNFNGFFDKQVLDPTGYPQLLSEAGYSVNYIGKWHLAKESDREFWHFETCYAEGDYAAEMTGLGVDVERSKEVQRLE